MQQSVGIDGDEMESGDGNQASRANSVAVVKQKSKAKKLTSVKQTRLKSMAESQYQNAAYSSEEMRVAEEKRLAELEKLAATTATLKSFVQQQQWKPSTWM